MIKETPDVTSDASLNSSVACFARPENISIIIATDNFKFESSVIGCQNLK